MHAVMIVFNGLRDNIAVARILWSLDALLIVTETLVENINGYQKDRDYK